MDALLSASAPILSIFLIPFITNTTTSLNLLFFYLTWSTLLLSNSPLKVEALGTLTIRLLFYLLPSYLFLAFDCGIPSAAAAIKEHGETGVPNGADHKHGQWRKVAAWSTLNVMLGVALQTGLELLLTRFLHLRSALKITTTLPFPYAVMKDLLKVYATREVLSYSLHRYALHHPSSSFSRLHSSWYHSLAATYSLTAHYDHPLAYLIRVFLPTYLPAILFRLHLLTYLLFLALVSLEELFAYSGYAALPSGFILGGIARRQERHLMAGRGAGGNYAAYGLTDLLAGTSLGSDVLDDIRDEADRRDVEGKVGRRAKEVGRKVKKGGKKAGERLRDRDEE